MNKLAMNILIQVFVCTGIELLGHKVDKGLALVYAASFPKCLINLYCSDFFVFLDSN
jgi:hypothetical protein